MENLNDERKIDSMVKGIIEEGEKNTSEGNWIVYTKELEEEYGISIAGNVKLQKIVESKFYECDAISDVIICDDQIDVNFYLDYCLNLEGDRDLESEDEIDVELEM